MKKFHFKGFHRILKGSPQRKGIVTHILILHPKKPNSANRKVARVKIWNKSIRAYIPGIGHDLKVYNQVLIQGGKIQDLPGISFNIIRGVLNASPVKRSSSRSKYGCKKSFLVG